MRGDVESGMILSRALGEHPDVFGRLYVAMIEAGEASGTLDRVLDRLAVQIEKSTQIKRRVKGAMIYPIVVLCFAFLVLTGMLLFLVPVFSKIFAQLNGQLPMLTQHVVDVSNLLRYYWFIIFPLIGASIFGLRRWKKTEQGRRVWDRAQAAHPDEDRRRLPQDRDGALLAHARDARRLRRRHRQGARDHRQHLGQLGDRAGARSRCATKVHEGIPIAQPLLENPVFPPMVSQMIKIGEETGELEKMLGKIADFYEDEVETAINALTSIIEPLMMIGVGAMVGVIVISMYLPMFKMLKLVGNGGGS